MHKVIHETAAVLADHFVDDFVCQNVVPIYDDVGTQNNHLIDRDVSFEHPKHLFRLMDIFLMDKKIIKYFTLKINLYIILIHEFMEALFLYTMLLSSLVSNNAQPQNLHISCTCSFMHQFQKIF